jgi:Tfp pilus assembly protein PilN
MEINLNLIPPNKKEEFLKNEQFKKVVKMEIFLTFIFVVFFGMLWVFKYTLNTDLSITSLSQSSREKSGQYEKINQYDSSFAQINSQVSQIMSIDQSQFYWSVLFSKLSALVPDGITLDGLVTKDYGVAISGQAESREKLISFKDKLSQESCFTDINLPLSDLVDKANAQFEIDFNIDNNCLKNK